MSAEEAKEVMVTDYGQQSLGVGEDGAMLGADAQQQRLETGPAQPSVFEIIGAKKEVDVDTSETSSY